MKITLRHIGITIIEMTIENSSTTITEEISNLKGNVPEEIIDNLRDIADQIELHNEVLETLPK